MMKNRYILIMAGGVGSRFWPASRESKPKQFLDILGVGKSLIRLTYERAIRFSKKEHILIATNEQYRNLVKEHLPELEEDQILCEPSRNNTAPCIAYAALKLYQKDPDSLFAVLPSDHVILKEDNYVHLMNQAFDHVADHDALLTLGITPSRPDTGYGYIEAEIQDQIPYKVKDFKEKPELQTAETYLNSGNYLWNAGMFIWSTSSILKAFDKHAPDIKQTLSQDLTCFNTANEQSYIDKTYPKTKSISIDYAILEPAKNVYTIPADIGWSDLGTWNSLHAYLANDENGNVIQGHVVTSDINDNFVRIPKNKIAVIKGLNNYIVVDEGNALLIYPKNDEQEIKSVRNKLQDKFK
ncbi:MAG: mannose-1-phosphate guanylyltransferase [Saprospiraceae bacterium]|nr:mannose-1-phosphate guanylyltransferase [Bacteroidia bacterium]NNF22923.1 mannose-1-phosphate guanylyltransferase [Saprospiraceae bacterium]